jgi:hypothetical protein
MIERWLWVDAVDRTQVPVRAGPGEIAARRRVDACPGPNRVLASNERSHSFGVATTCTGATHVGRDRLVLVESLLRLLNAENA